MKEPTFSDDYLHRVTGEQAKAVEKSVKKNKLRLFGRRGSTEKKPDTPPPKKKKFRLFRRVFWFFFKLGLLCLIVGSVVGFWYLNVLEKEISAKFSGQKWELPARIYARPLALFEGADISADDFAYELSLLPYVVDPMISKPGTYYRDEKNPNRFAIHTRGFHFWDGQETNYQLALQFEGKKLSKIRSLDNQDSPTFLRIEPVEIAGILSESGEDRVLVSLDRDVPNLLIDTLLAVEDRSFYKHFGVDPKGVLRALIANIRAGSRKQGASTLTQQLIKNYFLTNDRTYKRKLKEMAMAMSMELHYDKAEILEAYLNEIWIGQDGSRAVHGFGLGASFYYNRTLKELETHQIAMLVGMLKSPYHYNPRRNPEKALGRRNQVLTIMLDQGLISAEHAARQQEKPLGVSEAPRHKRVNYYSFLDVARKALRAQYKDEDLQTEGLKIFTTLDPIWQHSAELAVKTAMPALAEKANMSVDKLEVASVVVDPQLGEVKAIIGGQDFSASGFNRAYDAKRPIGSLVKPFIYLRGLMAPNNFTLATPLIDEAFDYPFGNDTWSPKNYDKKEHGDVLLVTALAKSYNLATARLGLNVGVDQIIALMKTLGYPRDVNAYPSVLLGAVDSNPFEMAQIYSSLANGGYYTPLRLITEVTGASGEALPRNFDLSVQKAVDNDDAYLINAALVHITQQGTAKQLSQAFPELRLAGKTGTTDDYRDSWFAGYGGNYLNVVWMGRDDNESISLSGTAGALQIWKAMTQALPVKSIVLSKPSNIDYYRINPEDGLVAAEDCDGSIILPLKVDTVPPTMSICGAGVSGANQPFGFEQWQPTNQTVIDEAFSNAWGSNNTNDYGGALNLQPSEYIGDPLQ